ncbi:hypothetical protein [Salinirubrum litoreum]|uniref:Uncharacterized protein n=1 Tax=Salinirubrum litoreum TaxID=1126234 RepID=A0ABD5R979_9EURY|nr:hypothetical protein [Salinirubrum litoreum]
MRAIERLLGYVPIVLMAGGTILYFVPATWVELPVETSTLGIVLAGLGVVLLYAGWYDRFDTESETSGEYKFDADPDASGDATTSRGPAQTSRYLALVGTYGSWILVTIGATLSWGQIRNPDRVGLLDRAPLELPWGEQPVLGFAFIVSGLALFALVHVAIPSLTGE